MQICGADRWERVYTSLGRLGKLKQGVEGLRTNQQASVWM